MKHITPEKRREIFQAWKMYGKQRAVALAAGVARQTAKRYAPGEPEKEIFVTQGYSTWSEGAKRRWDEFWAQPMCVERLEFLLRQRDKKNEGRR